MRADDTQSEPAAESRGEAGEEPAPADLGRARVERPSGPYILLDELPSWLRGALAESVPTESRTHLEADVFRDWARDHVDSPGLRQWCDDLLEWAGKRAELAAFIQNAGLAAGTEVRISSPSYFGNPWQVFVAEDGQGFVDRRGGRVVLRGKWKITESVRVRPVVERGDQAGGASET